MLEGMGVFTICPKQDVDAIAGFYCGVPPQFVTTEQVIAINGRSFIIAYP